VTVAAPPLVPAAGGRTIRLGSRRYPLLLPKLRDPRLHLAGVILSIQALGQTALGFDLSIAQILAAIGTCALLEVGITFARERVVAWPASAMLTGNGVALLLRVPGTEHGDWWSTNGIHLYVAIAALSLLSKYVIRPGGRHLLNPSNFGLSVGFLILGSSIADPQDLWWGPLSPGLVATLLLIVAGGILITLRNGLFGTAASFFVTFAAGTGVLAAGGHCIQARWSATPVCDGSYWWTLVTSPEILIFLFFMITDPKTIPAAPRARMAHGAAVGVLATLMVAPQTTEFATKVAILVALVVVCAGRPLLDRWFGPSEDRAAAPARHLVRSAAVVGGVGAFAAATLLLGLPSRTVEPLEQAVAVVEAGVARPDVELDADAVPEVVIDRSATRVQPPISAADAQAMGRDLVEGLEIEARARASRDVEIAATALAGERLSGLEAELTAAGDAPIEVRRHEVERLTLLQVRDAMRPQAPPSLAFRVEGTVATGSAAPGVELADVAWGTPQPLDATWVVVDGGEHHLIAGDAPG